MTPELKPCPFCEGPALLSTDTDSDGDPTAYVECLSSGCMLTMGPFYGDHGVGFTPEMHAEKTWNTRAPHPDTVRLELLANRADVAESGDGFYTWYVPDRRGDTIDCIWDKLTDDPRADLRTALDALPDTSGEVK